MKAFDRRYSLRIGSLFIDSKLQKILRPTCTSISFTVTRTITEEPNTATIDIYNLSPSNRNKLKNIYAGLEFQAGYKRDIGIIFKGNIRNVFSTHAGNDWITTIEAGDQEKEIEQNKINRSYTAGTPMSVVVADLVAALQLTPSAGILSAIAGTKLLESSSSFNYGVVLKGSASKELTGILNSSGYGWTVQNGEFQLINPLLPGTSAPAYILKQTLLANPEIGSSGELRCSILLDFKVTPGSLLGIDNKLFRAEICTYNGSIKGNDWYIDIEGQQL